MSTPDLIKLSVSRQDSQPHNLFNPEPWQCRPGSDLHFKKSSNEEFGPSDITVKALGLNKGGDGRFPDECPIFVRPEHVTYSLMALSDSRILTFPQIADVIEWLWDKGPKPEGVELAMNASEMGLSAAGETTTQKENNEGV